MSLLAKLEGDNLKQICQREVEELHRLFVAWFQGESDAASLTDDLKARLDPQFSHVAPNGQFLRGRDVLIGHLQDKFGCYRDRLFQIDIYAVKLLWHANGQALCTYEEWQSWQPEDSHGGGNDDDDDDGENAEVHQFGRLSTCLLHKKVVNGKERYQWIHVHETWLEAEEPQHPKEEMMSSTAKPSMHANKIDDETVMTGPVEAYHHTNTTTTPASPASPPPPEQARGAIPNNDTNNSDVKKDALSGSTGAIDDSILDDKHVLMLLSDQSLSKDQLDRQNRAREVMEMADIAYYELNGSDPEQRDKRNELFKLSRRWGKYPQFFLVDTDGNTIFWGEWEDMEQSGDNLKEDLKRAAMKGWAGTIKSNKDDDEDDDEEEEEEDNDEEEDDEDDSDDSDEDDSDEEEEDDDKEKQEEKEDTPTPSSASSPAIHNGANKPVSKPPGLLLLISSQVLSNDHKERQDDVVEHLKERNIPYLAVDGSIPEKREQRNELFKLSKVWGLYPQIFLIDRETRDITYWGGWDTFQEAKEKGNLEVQLGLVEAVEAPAAAIATSRDLPENATEPAATTSRDVPVDGITPDDSAALRKFDNSESIIVLLISNHSLSNEQMARQDDCRNMLKEKNLHFEEIDGSARESRDARNELFKVSKLWGRYPQLFISKPTGDNIFWGEWDEINESNKKGNLLKDLAGLVDKEAEPIDESDGQQYDDDEEEESSEKDEKKEIGEGVIHLSDSEEEPSECSPENGGAHEQDLKHKPTEEEQFLQASQGILLFEDDEDDKNEKDQEDDAEEKLKVVQAAASPIPQDASSKRHVSPKILKYAKPLTWENTLVGISISGFDIGTSQGPMADETWYKEVGDGLESIAQCKKVPRPRRQISLPEMVFPTAHVALEGYGVWISWDALDAMEEWARAHQEIPVNSGAESRGVSVLKAKDAKLWESKRQHISTMNANVPSVFHYDWTFSSPFCGKIEGGTWVELDETGMRTELLTDKTSPILFFDEIILFEDDLHDNGQVEFSVKIRVMPSCAYVLARLFVRVDNVVVRVRESRLLIDFFGIKPQIFRDVTWRECYWENLAAHGLPTDVRSWTITTDPGTLHALVQKLPEVDHPANTFKHAMLEPEHTPGASLSQLQMGNGGGSSNIYEL